MRNLRGSALFAFLMSCALSTFGQSGNQWRTAADIHEGIRGSIVGTVADVDEARSQIQVDPDDATGGRVLVIADSVTTQYNGFGGIINGEPEIFIGTAGFSNLRVGDRLEVRGTGRGTGAVVATYVTLLGRTVSADQTGVGTTRSPSTISTPTATTTATSPRVGSLEGTVQQVNASEGRIVIVTDRRQVMTVRTAAGTPVYYRNDVYRVANLEVGDRIRIELDTTGSSSGEVEARSIEVTRSVQEGGPAQPGNTIAGRVSRIDRTVDMVTIDTGRQSIRTDVATASDGSGRRVRALDFQVGDQVSVTGRYSGTANDLFMAETVSWTNEAPAPRTTGTPAGTDVYAGPPAAGGELPFVTIYGTVRQTLANAPQLSLQDSTGRSVRINVLEDFLVRNRTGGYTTADHLRNGDNVVVKAYRDADGNYIAQTIRMR
jgi:hypothetical protein